MNGKVAHDRCHEFMVDNQARFNPETSGNPAIPVDAQGLDMNLPHCIGEE